MKSAHPGISSAIMEKQKQDVDVSAPPLQQTNCSIKYTY